MTRAFKIVRDALTHAETFKCQDSTEIYFKKEDLTPEFMALANSYKSAGGDGLYILQTLNLKSVRICESLEDDVTVMMWAIDFLGWANEITTYDL